MGSGSWSKLICLKLVTDSGLFINVVIKKLVSEKCGEFLNKP